MEMAEQSPGRGRAVVVTGCSSGIGKATAVELAGKGFLVLATVRRESDAEELDRLGLPGLRPVRPVDLTERNDVARAIVSVVTELDHAGIKGLYALVNNAGGGEPSPVEMLPLERFQRELNARLLGSTALVQGLLPLIREGGGRIVWIMTPALIPTPYVAMIHACDFAVNCLARTLEIELARWNIPNVMIKCGGIKTRAGLRTVADVEALIGNAAPEHKALYEGALHGWAAEMEKFDRKRTEPEAVAGVVLKSLLAGKPKRRYSVGHMARAAAVLEAMPQSWADRILRGRFKPPAGTGPRATS